MIADTKIREYLEDGTIDVENTESLDEQLNSVSIDLRLASDFIQGNDGIVRDVHEENGVAFHFEPGVFYNVHTIERVSIPDDMYGELHSRSTLERAGLGVHTSGVIAPGWDGVLEFGVYNYTEEPITVEVGHPVVQLCFGELDTPAGESYDDRDDAKYQGQMGVSGPDEF